VPRQILDGFGVLMPPGGDAAPVPARAMEGAEPTPAHPAGLYERAGALRAINLEAGDGFAAMGPLPSGIALSDYTVAAPRDLAGILFTAALALLLVDCIAALAMAGALTRLRGRRAAAAMVVAAFGGLLAIGGAQGQDDLSEADRFAMRAALDTRLAYVLTGDPQIDDTSEAGLTGLTNFLAQRSSIEAESPMAIDIERDEIVFFPIVYWPVTPEAEVPSPQTLAKIDSFMKTGGTIFFDTRDADSDLSSITGQVGPSTPGAAPYPGEPRYSATRDGTARPRDHKGVLSSPEFPRPLERRAAVGRGLARRARRPEPRRRRQLRHHRVKRLCRRLGAVGSGGRPLYPVVPGGERQREFAYRTGLNIVMYAMTGNYKADQVHVPALLERLGQ
jgi:hypothetical protein